MQLSNGEIQVSPKIIYWVEMPTTIGEEEIIELLKRDVLVVNYNLSLNPLQDLQNHLTNKTGFFYNFDKILNIQRLKGEKEADFINNFIPFIKSFAPEKSLLHTSMINEKLGQAIKSLGIPYIEKNLDDKKIAITTVLNMIHPFFAIKGRVERSSLRLNLYPLKHKVNIYNIETKLPLMKATLKDVSLTGIGLVILDKNQMNFFKVKDLIKVEVMMRPNYFNINVGLVTRVDVKKQEIGINFDITNSKMVSTIDADVLSKIIYRWIKEIIAEHKKLE
ncbi:MAG: hypothetical protein MJB14_14815 [Spirochaetes bacterium]|nr:hypothetical protein [Spirochaetota bacterium]